MNLFEPQVFDVYNRTLINTKKALKKNDNNIGSREKSSRISKHFSSLKDPCRTTKGIQGNLEQAIADTMLFEKPETVHTEEDFGHGRIGTRTSYAHSELGRIEGYEKLEGLKSIVKIETETYEKISGKTFKDQRYYISNLPPPEAKVLNSRITKH